MARNNALQVGTAGEHYVAFRLAQRGFVVAIPRGGSPTVDILASDPTGNRTLAIQVKTAEWAGRTRGRGNDKRSHHLEFALGHKAANHGGEYFFYVFVDLKGQDPSSVPECYIVPSAEIRKYCARVPAKAKMVRWHPLVGEAEPYRENWASLVAAAGIQKNDDGKHPAA